jgi:WXG100 family type VII secretion target
MADKTQLNGDQLQGIATKLRSEADDYTNLLSQTRSQVDNLHGSGWVGRGADEFNNEMQTLMLPSFQNLIHALHAAADKIDDILKVFEEAQNESQGYFKFE